MADQALYEPRKLYASIFEKQFHANAEKYFDDLARTAKTDIGANENHVKAYEAAKAEVEAAKKKLNGAKR